MSRTNFASLIKNQEELELMRRSGKITASALKKVIEKARAGVSLLELDKIAEDEIIRLGGTAAFKEVPDYNWATCLALNEEVVHGIPREIKLKIGDILSIDLGVKYQGWITDAAWTVGIGQITQAQQQFLMVGEATLWAALEEAREGQRVGDISAAIEKGITEAGFGVVKSLAGHGVGRAVHEKPEILGYGKKGTGLKLWSGMTLAVEVIYTEKSGEVGEKSDGWTVASLDKSLGGLFEMTVLVTKKGVEVLTDWRKV